MRTLYTLLGGLALVAASLHGQAPKPAAPPAAPAASAKEIVLTGTTVNVKESGTPVSIRLFRWSTDEERTALVAAFTAPSTGRQGGRGGAPTTTAASPFMQAIQRSPNVGYLWTSEPTGYSVKLAWRTSQPDGSERVVIITEPRLGTYSAAWIVKTGTATDYGFTLLEFRINAKTAEAKSSLTSKIIADPDTKQLALEDFAAAPAILTKVKLTTK